jgi:hypothetical protein
VTIDARPAPRDGCLRAALSSVAALLLLPLLFSGLAFVHGSLELFPTEEQRGKARLFYGGVFALFAVLELLVGAGLWACSRATRRTRTGAVTPRG